jgi:uncharacterized Zn finger protein (UPF0148 family)
MPLIRPRCSACSQPLGDPPHLTIPIRCVACGTPATLAFGADGQPADFDAAFNAPRLLRWFAHARMAMARGAPGIAVGTCTRCDAPLLVSSKEPVSLPCPHCQVPVEGTAESVLADQWAEPWARVEGHEMALEYRLATVDDASTPSAGCPWCGIPIAPNDPSTVCPRCRAVTWVAREGGKRMQLAVRIDGTRQQRPFNTMVSLAQGEAMLRRDLSMGAAAGAGAGLLGVTGIGCAIAIALTVLGGIGIAIAVIVAR